MPVAECGADWSQVNDARGHVVCLKLSHDKANYSNSLAACQRLHPAASLATLDTRQLNQFVYEMVDACNTTW